MLGPVLAGTAVAAAITAGYQSMAPTGQWYGRTFTGLARGTKQIALTYDDGPNKTVEEIFRIELNFDKKTFTETSSDHKSQQTYQVDGLEKLSSAGLGTLSLTGAGLDNNKKTDVRITLKLGRNYYRYEKETRLPSAEFQFRDAYNFTRRNPPPGSR